MPTEINNEGDRFWLHRVALVQIPPLGGRAIPHKYKKGGKKIRQTAQCFDGWWWWPT